MFKVYDLTPTDNHKSFYHKAVIRQDDSGRTLESYGTPVLRISDGGGLLASGAAGVRPLDVTSGRSVGWIRRALFRFL